MLLGCLTVLLSFDFATGDGSLGPGHCSRFSTFRPSDRQTESYKDIALGDQQKTGPKLPKLLILFAYQAGFEPTLCAESKWRPSWTAL